MDNDAIVMTEGSYRSQIIKFAIPLFWGNLFQQMYSSADSLVVGNVIGSNALAAVSSSGSLIMLLIGLFQGLAMGAGVVIAQCIGAKNDQHTREAVATVVAVGFICGFLLTIIGVVLTPQILILMGTPKSIMPESVEFLRVYFLGSMGFVMYNTFISILQANGDSKGPLYYLIASSVVNIAFDIIFIYWLHLSVGFSALATVIAQTFSACLAYNKLRKLKGPSRVDLRHLKIYRPMLKLTIDYGLPSGLQNSLISVSNVVIQSYINMFGAHAVAGIGAYTRVEGFAFLPVTSFTLALTTFVAQNLGAGKIKRIKEGVRFGVILAVLIAEIIGLSVFTFAPQLIALFDPTPSVVAFGVGRARVCGFFFFLVAITHLIASVMRGAGKATIPMLAMMLCWVVVRLAVLLGTKPFFQDIRMANWIYPATWFLSTIVLLNAYRHLDFALISQQTRKEA